MNKYKIIIITGVLALLALTYWGYGKYEQASILRRLQTEGEKSLTPQEFLKLPEILSAEYKKDSYGSSTPEGTLALFIDALKKGDVELASKYFIVEKQVEMKNKIVSGIKSGGVTTLLSMFNSEIAWIDYKNGYNKELKLNYDGKTYSYVFVKNSFANIWKLESI